MESPCGQEKARRDRIPPGWKIDRAGQLPGVLAMMTLSPGWIRWPGFMVKPINYLPYEPSSEDIGPPIMNLMVPDLLSIQKKNPYRMIGWEPRV